jgi:1,4-dihydroxy-2-naphthoate octaprenyltransferase
MLRLIRLLHLLIAALTYSFGASLADFLGRFVNPISFWLGLFIVLLAQATMILVAEVFRLDAEPLLENETRTQRQILRNNVLYTSLACIAVISFAVYILYAGKFLSLPSLVFFLSSALIVLVYSVPPFRFVNRGAGEFLIAVHLAYIIPSISFTLQAGEAHRFLTLTIPLTFLAFSYFIANTFQSYLQDQILNRVTFLVRLGWERVVPFHHTVLLLAYVLFLMSPSFGLSLTLTRTALLTLPFALFQIFLLRSIALGAKPNWTLLHATSLAVFGLTTYFLTLTFWLR